MSAQLSSKEAAQRFEQEAQELWEELDRWMDAHPEATLKEIEQHLRPLRRELGAQLIGLQLLKRGAGVQIEAPLCPHCGQATEYKGIREKPTVGLEIEGEIPAAYYYCPRCNEGFFPPLRAFAPQEEETLE